MYAMRILNVSYIEEKRIKTTSFHVGINTLALGIGQAILINHIVKEPCALAPFKIHFQIFFSKWEPKELPYKLDKVNKMLIVYYT